MIFKNKLVYFFLTMVLLITSCTKQRTVITILPKKNIKRPLKIMPGDTTKIEIGFESSETMNEFKKSIDSVIARYIIDTVDAERIENYFSFTLRKSLENMDSNSIIDTLPKDIPNFPKLGESIKVYCDMQSFNQLFASFSTPTDNGSISNSEIIREINPLVYEVTIPEKSETSAFSIISRWNKLIKQKAATLSYYFRNVKGFNSYLQNKEAVISGLSALSNKKILIKLSKADDNFINNFSAKKLIPGIGKKNYNFSIKGSQITLSASPDIDTSNFFIKDIKVNTNPEDNPILAFSMNKYDMVIIYRKKNVNYAKKNIKDATLFKAVSLLYYISFNLNSKEKNNYLKSLVNPKEILKTSVLCTGEANHNNTRVLKIPKPVFDKPITIIYDKSDSIAISTAEKLFFSLASKNIETKLEPDNRAVYEKKLYFGTYDIAIGNEISDKNDKMELTDKTLYIFNAESMPMQNKRNGFVYPVFKINKFALCNKRINFLNSEFSKMFIRDSLQ